MKRLGTEQSRPRLDKLFIIVGLIVAVVFGVLTWINFQNRDQPLTSTRASEIANSFVLQASQRQTQNSDLGDQRWLTTPW